MYLLWAVLLSNGLQVYTTVVCNTQNAMLTYPFCQNGMRDSPFLSLQEVAKLEARKEELQLRQSTLFDTHSDLEERMIQLKEDVQSASNSIVELENGLDGLLKEVLLRAFFASYQLCPLQLW